MNGKNVKKASKKYKSSKRKMLLDKIITFFEIPIAIIIILIDNLCRLFIKPFKRKKTVKAQEKLKIQEIQVIGEKPKKSKAIKIPIFVKKNLAFAYLIILLFFITCGSIYALLGDKALAEAKLQVGSILVKLEEEEPFNNLDSIPEEGADTNKKIFRAVSICSLDTYVRARVTPVVEKYDEEEKCYTVIPININDVNLNINAPYWIYNEGYYYYNNILEPDAKSEDIVVTVVSIENSDKFQDTNIRITLHVELEAAQVRNDTWREVFNIVELPF